MSSPYRDAEGTQCLKCAALLLPDEHGDLVCPEGCGTWIPHAAVIDLFGERPLESVGKIAYWKVDPFEPTLCLACNAPLEDLYAALDDGAIALGQCVKHGVWLQRATRGELERAYADVIRNAPRVVHREPTFDERLASLERRVAELEAIVRRSNR